MFAVNQPINQSINQSKKHIQIVPGVTNESEGLQYMQKHQPMLIGAISVVKTNCLLT